VNLGAALAANIPSDRDEFGLKPLKTKNLCVLCDLCG